MPKRTLEEIAAIPDPIQRTSAAYESLGKSGPEMLGRHESCKPSFYFFGMIACYWIALAGLTALIGHGYKVKFFLAGAALFAFGQVLVAVGVLKPRR
jgi:hypothetical protein